MSIKGSRTMAAGQAEHQGAGSMGAVVAYLPPPPLRGQGQTGRLGTPAPPRKNHASPKNFVNEMSSTVACQPGIVSREKDWGCGW
jgi:hypothetical protein